MKAVVLLALVGVVAASPLKGDGAVPRTYIPEEENALRRRFMIMGDDNGKIHLVDLAKPPEGPRASINDVKFKLFTRNNRNNPDILPASDFSALLSSSHFNPGRRNLFICHGWNNNWQSSVNSVITPAVLNAYDVNVFVVDWSRPANLFYTSARSAVPVVGRIVGDIIGQLVKEFGVSLERVNLVGHSLGAHVAGCAGAQVRKVTNQLVNSIVGLDPAGPLYTLGNRDNRLDETDGSFVQVIHTNSGLLGFGSSIGHADYFPNGGRSQPGCGLDLAGTCAHSRAWAFYSDSISNRGFFSRQCNSHSNYNNGHCQNNHRSHMGELYIDKSARGDYFLNTRSAEPFGLW